MAEWFDIQNKGEDSGDIYIYGSITDEKWYDDDVTPGWFKSQVDKLKGVKNINLFINSPGGGVFAGTAIYNMLKRQSAKITARIDGIAASIASVIAMAADTVIMPKNAILMMHNPMSIAIGYADDMRKEAEILDKIKNSVIVPAYMEKAKVSEDKIKQMMDEETWLDGDEAFKLGFADAIEKNKNITACINDRTATINGLEINLDKYPNFPINKFEKMPSLKNLNRAKNFLINIKRKDLV